MKTNLYKNEILNIINKQFNSYTSIPYDFFTYENNGKPKDTLVFLEYKDFDGVVGEFFDQLENYLSGTTLFNTIKNHLDFKDCIIDFFEDATLKKGEISDKTKSKYTAIQTTNTSEFDTLVDEIGKIKLHFKRKYIKIYEKIRDDFGKDLILENKIHICPYCKRNYINVVTSNSDKTFLIKPDLDHFYDKATYTFLSATIENLVPSCNVCNSKLKGTKNFKRIKHLHPLIDLDIFKKIRFNYIGSNNTIYIENKSELTPLEIQTIETFRIEEIYNTHKEILFNIKNKYHHYNKAKRENLKDLLPDLNSYKILETIFYEYFHLNEIKEPMYKMKKDLFSKIVKK